MREKQGKPGENPARSRHSKRNDELGMMNDELKISSSFIIPNSSFQSLETCPNVFAGIGVSRQDARANFVGGFFFLSLFFSFKAARKSLDFECFHAWRVKSFKVEAFSILSTMFPTYRNYIYLYKVCLVRTND